MLRASRITAAYRLLVPEECHLAALLKVVDNFKAAQWKRGGDSLVNTLFNNSLLDALGSNTVALKGIEPMTKTVVSTSPSPVLFLL